MKTGSNFRTRLLVCAFLLGMFAVRHLAAQEPTPQQFGFETMRANGQLAINGSRGPRPLLVVVCTFAGSPAYPADHTPQYYLTNTFGPLQTQTISGFFWENSNHRFSWTPAGPGVIALPTLPDSENAVNTLARTGGNSGLTDLLFHSNLVAKTMMHQGSAFFAQFNRDQNPDITSEELEILFYVNEGNTGAAGAREPGRVQPPGFPFGLNIWRTAAVWMQVAFNTTVHELTHTLGATDLYYGNGVLNDHLTLMGISSGAADDRQTFHLDPWHKIQLGWCTPRLRSLRTGGSETIPAPQMIDGNAPVILYDPSVGPGHYFILEYRTRTSPNGPGYDANVAGDGLVVWRVTQGAVPNVDAGLDPAQNFWRRCQKCQGLHFIGNDQNPTLGKCPRGGVHSRDGSSAYLVVGNIPSAPGEHGWRWCAKCQGLFYGPGQALSHCPASGTHEPRNDAGQESGDYSLVANTPDAPGEPGWRWCRKCAGMFFGQNESASSCPADQGWHDGSQSGTYAVLVSTWAGGSVTPHLRASDGALTSTRLHVRPFAQGAGNATIEWWSELETWVEFNYAGPELGTFINPFNTLSEGVNASPWGGFVKIKAGINPEAITLDKRVILNAIGGPVVVGR